MAFQLFAVCDNCGIKEEADRNSLEGIKGRWFILSDKDAKSVLLCSGCALPVVPPRLLPRFAY